jgi:L-amino acid N-acyltransferase YncA
MSITIETMTEADWPAVAAIHREGIATGHATFASAPPDSFADWSDGKITACSLVSRDERGAVTGWSCLSKVSDRCVYAGVAEVSVYVAQGARGRGVGDGLLRELIAKSEAEEVWTLQAGIFPENSASLRLHARHGFREVGRREKLGKMTFGPRAGEWRDVLLLERRSRVAGAG